MAHIPHLYFPQPWGTDLALSPGQKNHLARVLRRADGSEVRYTDGAGAVGTDDGPTFLDPIYRPGHHADGAFLAAVRLGVRQHHWPFGNMPPQEGLTNQDINNIVAYVRQLQDEAGIR